jgi:hypothetical protein
VAFEFGVCDFKQTADGRNYSEQNGRNAEELGEACAARGFDLNTSGSGLRPSSSLASGSGHRARRAAAATVLFYRIPPVCVL